VIYTISAFLRRGLPESALKSVRIATDRASTDWGSATKAACLAALQRIVSNRAKSEKGNKQRPTHKSSDADHRPSELWPGGGDRNAIARPNEPLHQRGVCGERRSVRHPSLANCGSHESAEALHGLASNALLLRLALTVRHLRMFVGSLRMSVSLGRFLTTLRVLTLAMMFGSHLMALGGVLVVLSRFVVGVLGHVFLLARIAIHLNASIDDIVPCDSNLDALIGSD
jgi:hypothetical protein